MSLINREALLAEYDRVHVGEPGKARKLIEDAPTVEPEQRWIPCHVINQCYIPELKDIDYKGILFTYETITGKRLVKINWIERGRIVGKKMNGIPVAYKQLPEPYQEEGD